MCVIPFCEEEACGGCLNCSPEQFLCENHNNMIHAGGRSPHYPEVWKVKIYGAQSPPVTFSIMKWNPISCVLSPLGVFVCFLTTPLNLFMNFVTCPAGFSSYCDSFFFFSFFFFFLPGLLPKIRGNPDPSGPFPRSATDFLCCVFNVCKLGRAS